MPDTITMNQILWRGDVSLMMDDSTPRVFFVVRDGIVRRKTLSINQAVSWYEDEAQRCDGCGA